MAARQVPEPGVYRFFALIDGRPAYFIVDWHGVESEMRILGNGEHEADVVRELEEELGEPPSPSPSADRHRVRRPVLRLL